MKKIILFLCFLLLMQSFGFSVVITFEDLARFVYVTNQYQAQGVIFSYSGNYGQTGSVSVPDFGVYPFGGDAPMALCYGGPGDKLTFRFVTPGGTNGITDYVNFRIGDGDSASETFRVSFFDINANLLHYEDHTTYSGAVDGGVDVIYSQAGIHKVEILGLPGQSGGSMDDLVFNPVQAVPEASSLMCVLLTILYLFWIKK